MLQRHYSLGSNPGSVTTVCDRESHRAAPNKPSVVIIRGGFGPRGLDLAHCALATSCGGPGACRLNLVVFRGRTGVAVIGQDCDCQLDITKLERKRGKKNEITDDMLS